MIPRPLQRPSALPAIELDGVGKRYEIYDRPHHRLLQTILRGRRTFFREFWAVRDVSLVVRRGETVGLIGRNGSGKSTILQLVAGILAPTTGRVVTRGRVAALLELGSGFNPEFTGRENVYLNGAILGVPRHEMTKALPAIEDFAGIGDFIDQPVGVYSSGMVVRLAFAVAVHVTPEILIVDEALAVGDTAFQSKCLDRIRRMQQDGVAIVLVSHSMNAILEFCDRAAYVDCGRLVAVGESREVVERYASDVTQSEAQLSLQRTPGPGAAIAATQRAPTEILAVTVTDDHGRQTSTFAYGEEIRVILDVAFHQRNGSPCFGIQLKGTDDIALWATSTALMGVALPAAGAGERRSYAWRLRATLGGARFVVAVGVGDNVNGEYRRHARLSYAGHFDVLPRPGGGAGWLDLKGTFAEVEGAQRLDAPEQRGSTPGAA